jgi:hypothetical protein
MRHVTQSLGSASRSAFSGDIGKVRAACQGVPPSGINSDPDNPIR